MSRTLVSFFIGVFHQHFFGGFDNLTDLTKQYMVETHQFGLRMKNSEANII